jgi:demethylmenaquinone methyltransferase/2-methoxy-6-polyprenyl-1,4-benzoquinol methylase
MKSFGSGGAPRNKIDFYSLIAPFYDALVGPFLRAVRKDIRKEAGAQGCRRALDVACGTGEQAIMLAQAGLDVTAVDTSGAMIAVARRKSPPAVSYVLGDAGDLPFGTGVFDFATVSLALHEMAYDTRMQVTGEMLRTLAPDGRLAFFDYAAQKDMGFSAVPGFLGIMERIAGAEHFRNFVRFTRMGGIHGFLGAFPLRIVSSRAYFLGALRLVIAQKGP